MEDTPLIIGSRTFNSRLLVGTGKYKDLTETDLAIQASGAEIVTVTPFGKHPPVTTAMEARSPTTPVDTVPVARTPPAGGSLNVTVGAVP